MKTKTTSILLIFGWILAACQPAVMAPLPAIITPLRIVITPANAHFASLIERCTSELPEVTAVVDIIPFADAKNAVFDLAITSGEGLTNQTYSLGEGQLILIVHPSNPVDSLTADQISGIFGGFYPTWQSIIPEQTGEEPNKAIQVFSYSQSDDLGKLFINEWMGDTILSLRAFFPPDPQEMVKSVADDPMAIGYIPAAWKSSSVKKINTLSEINYPVLMSTLKEPEGGLRELMGCLQKEIEK